MEETKGQFDALIQVLGKWLRDMVRDEVAEALEADRLKAKPPKNFTRHEVCKLLRISLPTLWQKTKSGEIEAIKVGRRVLYSEEAIKRYLEG